MKRETIEYAAREISLILAPPNDARESAHQRVANVIERLLADEREKVREILSWTLGELQGRGYSEIKPKHACGYTGNPEAAYCEFCDMWVKAQEYLNPTVPSSTEEGKK